MRLLLKLECLKTVSQEHFFKGYFTAMHGWLAPVAGKDEKYGNFCFGNLFPIKNEKVEQGEEYSIIISSSNPSTIEKIFFHLERDSILNIGELQFKIKDFKIKHQKLKNNSVIESISPVNITTNENGNIRFHRFANNGYLKKLEGHLLRKYAFLKNDKSDIDLFKNVEVDINEKRPFSCFHINFFNKEKNDIFKVCGSKLVLKFNGISEEQLKIFQTLFDAGFGERTVYGAGFMVERYKE